MSISTFLRTGQALLLLRRLGRFDQTSRPVRNNQPVCRTGPVLVMNRDYPMNSIRYARKRIMLFCLMVVGFAAKAQQGFFVPLSSAQLRVAAPAIDGVQKYTAYQLRTTDLRTYLAKAPLENQSAKAAVRLDIPLPNGTTEPFIMFESPILAPAVAAQHPDIKTYTGKGATHPTYTIRLSFTSSGFDAIILGVAGDAVYYTKASVDPADQQYVTYFARDAKKNDNASLFGTTSKCGTATSAVETLSADPGKGARQHAALNNTGTTLRTFRLALSATKEFTQRKGEGNVTIAFNALVGYVNRMNAVYRVELSVAFTLVSNTSTVFTAANDGGLNNADLGSMLDRNQIILDNAVGNANYDIGHVIGFSGGSGEGLAQASSACKTGDKAKGATSFGDGSFAPVFDDQTFSHEVGHQFGMSHTFNSIIPVCTTREPTTSVEPGAGTTIMSYGYTCSGTAGNDDYETPAYQPILNFHTISYQQAAAYINTLSCFTTTTLTNAVPVISAFPTSTTIPKSTPFTLSGAATDANAGDVLSYSWEGTNIGTVVPTASTLANTALPPFFRSYAPASTGTRTFPRLEAILNGTNMAKGDKLPSVGIATTHTLTIRDNAGGLTYQSVTVTVDGNSGPFLETTNLAGSYPFNSSQTITWSVNNTTAPPISCATVNILLSTDGGQTFPTTLLANTPNDGSEAVTFPALATTSARIKVVSSNSIFFDISNANFTIVNPAASPIVSVNSNDPSSSEGGGVAGRRIASNGQARAGATIGAATASDPGFIQFERTNITGPLVINYQIGGTATNGADFTTLPTSITFADGQSVYTEEIDPIEDDIVEGDETIIITLVDSDTYDPDPNEITTTVTIRDNDTSGPFSITGVTTVSCQTVTAGLRRVIFTPQYAGTSGQPISFSVANELVATTNPGPYILNLYTDNPTITLRASQSSPAGEASFAYNWLAACGGSVTPPPPTPGSSLSITGVTTVSCQTVTAGLRRVSFTPQYAGLSGQPVSFSVANELLPTTTMGPYTLNLYTDNPVITLKATQRGTAGEASFRYNWLAACGSNARFGSEPSAESALSVRLLSNPARNGQVSVEVRGVAGESLQLSLTDLQGRVIGSHLVGQAGLLEQHTFEISRQPTGLFLLRAATATKSQTVRVIKAE